MCRPEARDRGFGLGPRSSELRMGVRHTTNAWEAPVKFEMRREIGGRPQLCLDYRSPEVADDHVLGLKFFVGNSAGLDGDEALVAIDTAGVPEGVDDEAAANEFQICLEPLFAERFQEHGERDILITVGHSVNVYDYL